MDDHLVALGRDEHHDLEQVPGTVGADDQPAVWILASIVDSQGVLDRMEHVVVSNPVPTCGPMNFHKSIVYYKSR